MQALRAIYRYWAALLFLAVLLQIAFAGYGAFDTADRAEDGTVDGEQFDDSFGLHAGLGYLIFLASLVLLLLALGGRLGRRRVLLTLLLSVLILVQIVLFAWGGASVPWLLGALHPVNAVAIAGLTGYLADRAWRGWTDFGAVERA